MITTILQGGLGNQLFQYFMGLSQATRHGTTLQLDVTRLQRDSMRQYNLGLFPNITEKLVIGSVPTVSERGLPYNRDLEENIKDGDVLEGYWQSEKYFRHLFPFNIFYKLTVGKIPQLYYQGAIERIREAKELSTFLTIRRTDYLKKQDFHGVLPREYYWSALYKIAEDLGETPQVFVFSDEPGWCKENLDLPYPFEVMGTYDQTTAKHLGREDLDLYLMSLCTNGVMANSSFSWWGAWLGDFQDRKRTVVAPKQWFTTTQVDGSTIVPERWVRL